MLVFLLCLISDCSNEHVDLDSITDELEREATVGIIHNCKLSVCRARLSLNGL